MDMWKYMLWIAGAAVLSFGIAAVFSGRLKLRRNIYLLVYVPVSASLIAGFYLWSGSDPAAQISSNWTWGLLGAAAAGILVVRNVLSQRSHPRRSGLGFAIDLLWPGFIYGFIDGMLLSVIPVMAAYGAFSGMSWTEGAAGQIGLGAVGFVASLVVTTAYHVGYREFRGKSVLWTLVGNGLLSLAFLISGNPLAAVLPHIAMHVASVFHGPETTVQLPPHYEEDAKAA
jgi:hypothetical protein